MFFDYLLKYSFVLRSAGPWGVEGTKKLRRQMRPYGINRMVFNRYMS